MISLSQYNRYWLIRNCTFIRNGGNGLVGALYVWVYNDGLIIQDSLFYDNLGSYSGAILGEKGGAIFAESEDLSISNCIFFNNTSTYAGGAVYFASPIKSFSIYNTTFGHNVAETYGGALYMIGSGANVHISDSSFQSNVAMGGGGTIYAYQIIDVLIERSDFSNNIADGLVGGGALYFTMSSVSIVDCDVTNNVLSGGTFTDNFSGGAMHFDKNNIITINSTRILDNEAYYFVRQVQL